MAEKDNRGRWTAAHEFRRALEDLGLRKEIVRNLYSMLGHRASSVARFDPSLDNQTVTGAIVATGANDALHDQRYLVVRDSQERMHYVKVANREALSVLEAGGLVHVSEADPRRTKTDQRIAEVARFNEGLYSQQAHSRILPAHFAGPMSNRSCALSTATPRAITAS